MVAERNVAIGDNKIIIIEKKVITVEKKVTTIVRMAVIKQQIIEKGTSK